MTSALRADRAAFALLVLFAAGCAQPAADNTFTIRKIDSTSSGDGTVRIKLTTKGDLAEADESTLVAYVKILAVREASKRQRQIADERARAVFHKMKTGQHGKNSTRYLAVATENSAATKVNKGGRSVMIWDTQAEAIVGNQVYDVEVAPAIGTVARFETYAAEYVGQGM